MSLSGSPRSSSPRQKMQRSPFPPPDSPCRIYSIRQGENSRSTSPLALLVVGVDQVAQFLADLEEGDPLLGNGDFFAGLGVAALLGAAHADGEAAEAPDLYLLAPLQRVLHVVKDGVHDDFAL